MIAEKCYYALSNSGNIVVATPYHKYRLNENKQIGFLNNLLNARIKSIVIKNGDLYVKTSSSVKIFKSYKYLRKYSELFDEFFQILLEDHEEMFRVRNSKHPGVRILAASLGTTLFMGLHSEIKIDTNSNEGIVLSDIQAEELYIQRDNPLKDIKDISDIELNSLFKDYDDLDVTTENVDSKELYSENNYDIGYIEKDMHYFNIPYGENADTKKANKTREYMDIINKYAEKFYLDPNVVLNVATQERGVHSPELDEGGSIGLMQVYLSAYPDGYTIPVVINNNGVPQLSHYTFNVEHYKTLEGNIEAGCAILNHACNTFRGNLPAVLYGYNAGENNCKKAINKYSNRTGYSYDEIIDSYDDSSWVSTEYAEKVFQWSETPNLTTYYATFNDDGSINMNDVNYTLGENLDFKR